MEKPRAAKRRFQAHGFTWLLIGLNVAVFLIMFSMPEPVREWAFQTLSFSGGNMLEAWRWFSSLFLHISASHLFFNMLGLYFFGKILEEEVRREWFLSAYLISGLIGNFVFMLTSAAPVAGASGCVFGVMGAAMLLNPVKRIRIYLFPLPLGIIAILFLVFEALVVYFQPQEFSGVANIAHLGGVITGSVFAFFYDWRRASKGLLVLFVCILLLVILAPIFALITGIGGIVLGAIEAVTGFFLYGIAGLLSFIWV
jgi:membrane associated rhomboid family serine protease